MDSFLIGPGDATYLFRQTMRQTFGSRSYMPGMVADFADKLAPVIPAFARAALREEISQSAVLTTDLGPGFRDINAAWQRIDDTLAALGDADPASPVELSAHDLTILLVSCIRQARSEPSDQRAEALHMAASFYSQLPRQERLTIQRELLRAVQDCFFHESLHGFGSEIVRTAERLLSDESRLARVQV